MKLFLLQVGRVRPPNQVEETILPVPAYLIETDTGEHILIDTGLDRRLIGAYHHQPHLPHLLDEEEDLLTHLARLSLTAQDIRLVICSHLILIMLGIWRSFTRRKLSFSDAYMPLRSRERFPVLRGHETNGTHRACASCSLMVISLLFQG